MRHVVEGMVMLTNDDTVTAAALPEEIARSVAATGREPGVSAESAAVRDLDAVERDAIRTAIARRQGNLTMVCQRPANLEEHALPQNRQVRAEPDSSPGPTARPIDGPARRTEG